MDNERMFWHVPSPNFRQQNYLHEFVAIILRRNWSKAQWKKKKKHSIAQHAQSEAGIKSKVECW